MKKVLVIFSLLSITSSAFAMHAYGEDSCTAKMINGSSLDIGIANGEPANPHKIENPDSDEFITVEFKGAPVGGNEQGSELVLQKTSETNVIKRNTDDGCFEGWQQTSNRDAKVVSVSKKLAQTYGLKAQMTVHFVCYSSASAPMGKHCN